MNTRGARVMGSVREDLLGRVFAQYDAEFARTWKQRYIASMESGESFEAELQTLRGQAWFVDPSSDCPTQRWCGSHHT
jgi:hypothetical protein